MVESNIKKHDSIAQDISWSPAKTGGANFKTHKLIKDAFKIRFVPTIFGHLFALLFAGVSIFLVLNEYTNIFNATIEGSSWLKKIVPLVFAVASGYLLYSSYRPREFDLKNKIYRFGWLKPEIEISHLDNKHCLSFSHIHAIQILDEIITDDDGSYTSTELNLVLKDGQRMNVIDHSSRASIMEDAKYLSQILIIPVWYQEAGLMRTYEPLLMKANR